MFWQEEKDEEVTRVPDNVVDLAFGIDCRTVPVDHAYALSNAIRKVLPWFDDEHGVALHLIHVADSGNGWEKPTGADDLMYLSRRTKLTLRLPKDQVENARSLSGQTLDVAGHALKVGEAKVVPLHLTDTLYARYVVAQEGQSEEAFIADAVRELHRLGLKFKKVLAGKEFHLGTPNGALFLRSLMVAEMPQADAIVLQEQGLGPHRSLGCGVFTPHKSIKKVSTE